MHVLIELFKASSGGRAGCDPPVQFLKFLPQDIEYRKRLRWRHIFAHFVRKSVGTHLSPTCAVSLFLGASNSATDHPNSLLRG